MQKYLENDLVLKAKLSPVESLLVKYFFISQATLRLYLDSLHLK